MLPVASTIEDNSVRNVNPRIVGPDRSWYTFVENDLKAAKVAAKGIADVMLHCAHGNDKRILNGAYCADAFFQCQKRVKGSDGSWIAPYRPLASGFVQAFKGQRVGCYVGSPAYSVLDMRLGAMYSPYADTFSFIVIDHCTSWPDPMEITRIAAGRTIMVEGGSPSDIARWPADVGWFLESRSPSMFTVEATKIAETRRVVCYCGFGTTKERMDVAKEAIGYGMDPCVVFNDLDDADALTVEQLAGLEPI